MKIKYQYQKTKAYSAGCMTGKLYNTYYTRKDLPSVIQCMRDFQILKTIFGKYYSLMKNNKYCNSHIVNYEQFDQLALTKEKVGSYTDFMLGYADTINKNKI